MTEPEAGWVIRYDGLAGWHEWPGRLPHPGEYLTSYDPDGDDGRGVAFFDNRPDYAIRFRTEDEALGLIGTVSTVRPTRQDGKPNRPLTAFKLNVVRDPLRRPASGPEPEETPCPDQ